MTTKFDIDQEVFIISENKIKQKKIKIIRITKEYTGSIGTEYGFSQDEFSNHEWKPSREVFRLKEELLKYLAK